MYFGCPRSDADGYLLAATLLVWRLLFIGGTDRRVLRTWSDRT